MAASAPARPVVITAATAGDTPVVVDFIRRLAAYERLSSQVVTTEADLERHLFGPRPVAEALVAREAATPVGYALFFPTFSSFLGRPGLWLEDLFVVEEARGRGIGRALLAKVAAITVERGWGRLEWSVLDWNEPAIAFYRGLGADVMADWRVCRLTGEALTGLARR